jgi:hypothetical protein
MRRGEEGGVEVEEPVQEQDQREGDGVVEEWSVK